MAGFSVDSNADQVAADFRRAGLELADLDPANSEAGRVVLATARPPRRHGGLAASLRADVGPNGVTFASSARYWTFVHFGAPRHNVKAQPWYPEAIRLSTDQLVDIYAAHARSTLNKIGP